MNDIEYQFCVLQRKIKELEFDSSYLPYKVDGDLKEIREHLNWIENHCLPIGISKAMMERLRDKVIFVSAEKEKSALAFQIHRINKRPSKVFELVGIRITFSNSENAVPGLTFEGTRKNPIVMKASDLPWITDSALKSPKKFEEWIKNHLIEGKNLSEKVEQFAVVDLGIVLMNELGLGESDHQAMDQNKIDEEREKNASKPSSPQNQSEDQKPGSVKGSEDISLRRVSPMYRNPSNPLGIWPNMDEDFYEL